MYLLRLPDRHSRTWHYSTVITGVLTKVLKTELVGVSVVMCRHVHASLHQSMDDITINNADSSSMTNGRGLVHIKRGRVAPTHKYDTEQHMDPLSTAATKYQSSQIKDNKTW